MILVAVAALACALGAKVIHRQRMVASSFYRAEAAQYRFLSAANEMEPLRNPTKAAECQRLAERYRSLAKKYSDAASRPWDPVPSDADPPK